jgi:Flp pilus assembly protein TadG
MKKFVSKFLKNDNGMAAIEMAFVAPLMLLIYFGLVDITGLISFNRKVTAAASLTADLVSQKTNNILKPQVDDIYNAVSMIMAPTPMTDVRVEVYGLRKSATGVTQIWKTSNGTGPACTVAVAPSDYSGLMSVTTGGATVYNDMVIVRTCMNFTPYVATVLGYGPNGWGDISVTGAPNFAVNSTAAVRPRSSLTLNCYMTTVAANTLCS